ncbi:MAG: hypothetical protein ACU84H_11320 [Gammaproteobacteria bacterium]
MPRDIPTYTHCAGPGVARSHQQLGGLTGFLVNSFLNNKLLTVGLFLAFLVGLVLLNNPLTWGAFGIAIIAALTEFKDWYYNGRLLCIHDRDCAIGTVISEPTAAFDGDRKLNLMLAPYGQRDQVETLLEHVATNEAMLINNANFNDPPFHSSAPALPVAAQRENDFDILRNYVRALQGEDPDDGDSESNMFRQVLIGVVDRLMTNPARNFYNRFYRKDTAHIADGSALWNAIPEDFDPTVNWQGPNAQSTRTHDNPYQQRTETLNPMFRYDVDHLVTYLHCEIEGYYIKLLIDNLILAFSAWLASVIALGFLGPLAPLAALAIALLLFFLKWLIDQITGNDGDADEPDVDWDDPDVPEVGETERVGDMVVVYGNSIMDTEHHQYFEIHPVRAYYIVARNSLGSEPVLVNGNMEQEEFGHENFDPAQITAERADAICQIVTRGEEEDPGPVIERKAPTALSYGMQTRYAGGQQQVR